MRSLAISIAVLCLMAGCALPRVTVLHDPLSPEEHLDLGMAYEGNGEYDLAVREYEAAAKKIPRAHLFAGNACYQNKDYAAAERHFRRAMEKLPDDPRPMNNLAWLYCTQKRRLDEAESLARRALKLVEGPGAKEYRDTLECILRAKGQRETRAPGR